MTMMMAARSSWNKYVPGTFFVPGIFFQLALDERQGSHYVRKMIPG